MKFKRPLPAVLPAPVSSVFPRYRFGERVKAVANHPCFPDGGFRDPGPPLVSRFAFESSPELFAVVVLRPFRDPFDPARSWSGVIVHLVPFPDPHQGDGLRFAKRTFEDRYRLMQIPVSGFGKSSMQLIRTAGNGTREGGRPGELEVYLERRLRRFSGGAAGFVLLALAWLRARAVFVPLVTREDPPLAGMDAMAWSPATDGGIVGAPLSEELMDLSEKHGNLGAFVERIYRKLGDEPPGSPFIYGSSAGKLYEETKQCREFHLAMKGRNDEH